MSWAVPARYRAKLGSRMWLTIKLALSRSTGLAEKKCRPLTNALGLVLVGLWETGLVTEDGRVG